MIYEEKVIRVIDGDTFETANYKVRLADFNAAELGEVGGARATDILKRLIEGKIVGIEQVGISYDRLVAEVTINGKSVNEFMRRNV